MNTIVLGLDSINSLTLSRDTVDLSVESRSPAQLDITPLIKNRNPVGKHADNFLIPSFGTCRRTQGYKGQVAT